MFGWLILFFFELVDLGDGVSWKMKERGWVSMVRKWLEKKSKNGSVCWRFWGFQVVVWDGLEAGRRRNRFKSCV